MLWKNMAEGFLLMENWESQSVMIMSYFSAATEILKHSIMHSCHCSIWSCLSAYFDTLLIYTVLNIVIKWVGQLCHFYELNLDPVPVFLLHNLYV
jgi:hypothetical protein